MAASPMSPPILPPREIDDPTDVKPDDWVDDEYVVDETAKKPEDWDETSPKFIPDPEDLDPPEGWLTDEPKIIADPQAVKPEEWEDEIHGTWEPGKPQIRSAKRQVGAGRMSHRGS